MEEVIVSLGFSELPKLFNGWPKGSRALLASTEPVYARFGSVVEQACRQSGWTCGKFIFPCGDEAKEFSWLQSCCQAMQEFEMDRRSVVLSLGGGALMDVSGFAASCYMRGIDLVTIPTTLLGMIDAAVGGKNGINFGDLKNAVGTFHVPKAIYVNVGCLDTLAQRELRAGLAEAIKYGLIWDPALLTFLETHRAALLQREKTSLSQLIERCIEIKQEIVAEDPRDTGLRAILNFGHTAGHALERCLGNKILHGEAVAIGMNIAAKLGYQRGVTPAGAVSRLHAICEQFGLPTELPEGICIRDLLPWMKRDKKASGGLLTFVLLRDLGEAEGVEVEEAWLVNE